MLEFSETDFANLIIHHVGNKENGDELVLSDHQLKLAEDVKEMLKHYFLSSFKSPQFYNFDHPVDLDQNRVFKSVTNIFDNPDSFTEESQHIAEHLYNLIDLPNVKDGEFYVVYLNDIAVEDEWSDAIGIFKSENKETFLKVYEDNKQFDVKYDTGININKLDKGCLIFNTEKEFGYKICIVDKTNPIMEAVYWKDKFLQLKPRDDDFYKTKSYIDLCKGFVTDVFNPKNEVERPDQIEFLNRSKKYFTEEENFKEDDFEQRVMGEPSIIDAFKDYKKEYETQNEMMIGDEFNISQPAVKKSRADFKSILKLDKNFHIYIHGRRDYIEKGFDHQKGLNFYKVFFETEN